MIHVKRIDSYNKVIETISFDREKLISKANRIPVAFQAVHPSTLEKRCSDLITKNWDFSGFIAAIKLYRSEERVTLKYAKAYCEELRSKLTRGDII